MTLHMTLFELFDFQSVKVDILMTLNLTLLPLYFRCKMKSPEINGEKTWRTRTT